MESSQLTVTLLEGILNASPNAITIYEAVRDGAQRIVDMRLFMLNEQSAAVLGRPANALIGRLFSELVPPALRDERMGWILHIMRTGEPFEREVYTPTLNGDHRWVSVSARRFEEYLIVTYTDITERKWAELEQQRKTDLLVSIVNGSLNGMVALEAVCTDDGNVADFRVMLANPIAAQLARSQPDALIGQSWQALFPGITTSGLREQYVRVFKTGQPYQAEVYYPYDELNGWFMLLIYPLADKGIIVSFQDVTAVRRAQQDRERQTEIFQTVVDNSPTGLVLYEAVRDASGQLIDFVHTLSNPANDAVTGRASGELIGQSMLTLFPGNQTNGHFDELRRVVETGQAFRRLMHYREHGIRGWFDMQFVKLGDGVLVTFLDVTKLKEAEQQAKRQTIELEQANRELRRSNDNLEQFAYVASHDLQEPLRKIQTFGSLLQQQFAPELNQDGRDFVGRMLMASERMSLLIRDLLLYSRLSTQREAVRPIPLQSLVAAVLDDLETSITDTHAQVDVGELPTVPGDGSQLRQLFQNLLSNALKFRRAGESPVIRITSRAVRGAELPPVLGAPATTAETYHEISIVDNGIGFNEKYVDRIFQVFQRLHGKGSYPGSGVGLAICKKVVDNHNGYIAAESLPGEGATFRVYLPG